MTLTSQSSVVTEHGRTILPASGSRPETIDVRMTAAQIGALARYVIYNGTNTDMEQSALEALLEAYADLTGVEI